MAVGPPSGGTVPLPHRGKLFHATEVASGGALATSRWRGQPCPLCGGPVDVFGDHSVSCKKSGFGDRHLGTKNVFCQVLTQSRAPHDLEVDIAGNGRRPADILLKEWDGRRDLVVDLIIVHPNPVAGRPLRGGAATFLKDKGDQKCREIADSCGRMGWTSPQWCSTHGGGSTGPGRRW